MKNLKKFKMKKLILFTVTPVTLLAVGGTTTAVVLNNTKHVNAEKTDIISVFSKLSTWASDVAQGASPAMTAENCLNGEVFTGAGIRESNKNFVWDADNLLYYLQQQVNAVETTTANPAIVNELDVVFQPNYNTDQANNKWQKVTISANQHSVNYSGSINLYYYLDKTDYKRDLSTDFTNTEIDMSAMDAYASVYAPTNTQILNAIKSKNSNLNINSAHIQYCLDTTAATPNWVDWATFDAATGSYKTTNTAGVNGTAADETNWFSLWSTAGHYGRTAAEKSTLKGALRLISNSQISSCYPQNSSVEFSITFARPFIYDQQGWGSSTAWGKDKKHEYIVTPDERNFKTTFVQAYGDGTTYPWFTKLNKLPDSWSFTKVSVDSKLYANFQMDGTNPYFAAFTSEASKKNHFLYEVKSKIDFAATYGKFWPTEGVSFYAHPTQNDVVSYLTYMIAKDTSVDPVYWAEVTISINTSTKTITLSVRNSLHYNDSDLTLTYTIG